MNVMTLNSRKGLKILRPEGVREWALPSALMQFYQLCSLLPNRTPEFICYFDDKGSHTICVQSHTMTIQITKK